MSNKKQSKLTPVDDSPSISTSELADLLVALSHLAPHAFLLTSAEAYAIKHAFPELIDQESLLNPSPPSTIMGVPIVTVCYPTFPKAVSFYNNPSL